ncbi:hypothetical protein LV85_00760 [Algoriphagus chordae]|uniref:Uncharacterized protein n=1 Tax=Algoriphagus chordae TaxID=237019 RepID=A0A2W7R8V7_9BACT|nr:hypothetical protein LV85_00760 [Algoriphagus chordae]
MLQYNPISKKLFTENGELIKTLNCPYRIGWSSLPSTEDSKHRTCSQCEHSILDTAKVTEKELVQTIKTKPNTCLKVDINQDNLTISLA